MIRIIIVTTTLFFNFYGYLQAQNFDVKKYFQLHNIFGHNNDDSIFRIETVPINDSSSFITKAYREDSSMIYWIHLKSVNPEKRNGRYVSFFPNKKIHCSGQYDNNIPFGEWRYFNTNGNLDTVINYNEAIKSLLAATDQKKNIFNITDKDASFKGGGLDSFRVYIQKHFIFPDYALKRGIEGDVTVQFVVSDSGRIILPRTLRSIDNDLCMELFRVIDAAPRWQPAKQRGKPVCKEFTLTFTFIGMKHKNYPIPEDQRVFISVEENATFQGGDINKFRIWIGEHVHFPESVLKMGLEGKIIVQFVVNSKGLIEKVVVLRGVDPALDSEVVKTIMSSPVWQPGSQGGKPVKQQFVIPVNFKLTR